MSKIVSLDIETTGLDLELHEVWEVGIVPLDSGREHLHFQFQPTDLEKAEAAALQVGMFYDRFEWLPDARFARDMLVDGVIVEVAEGYEEDDEDAPKVEKPTGGKALTGSHQACYRIAKELEGATVMGLNVGSFDGPFLTKMLREYGHAPTWNHRFLELGSYAAGAWGAKNALSGKAIADRLEKHGVANRGVHNAYNDAQWNVDAYNFIRNGGN